MTTFDRAVALVLEYEGGLVDDPNDPGGVTNFGISQRAYPDLDIAALTEAEAKELYYRDYWEPIWGDELPAGLALMTFDAAVNMGIGTAVRQLQVAVGADRDGVMGPATLERAWDTDRGVVAELCAERCLAYTELHGFGTYGRGWLRRATRTMYEATLA